MSKFTMSPSCGAAPIRLPHVALVASLGFLVSLFVRARTPPLQAFFPEHTPTPRCPVPSSKRRPAAAFVLPPCSDLPRRGASPPACCTTRHKLMCCGAAIVATGCFCTLRCAMLLLPRCHNFAEAAARVRAASLGAHSGRAPFQRGARHFGLRAAKRGNIVLQQTCSATQGQTCPQESGPIRSCSSTLCLRVPPPTPSCY